MRGALSEARAGVQRLRTAAAPVSLTFARAGASLAIRNRGGLIFYPRAKANSFLGAVSLSLRSLPLCSLPSPPKSSARDLSGSPRPRPLLRGDFLGGEERCRRGTTAQAGWRGWGWGRRQGELFTRKSRGCVFEQPRPRPGCIVLARAPGACGGRSEVRWPGRRRVALCSGCAPRPPAGPPARALRSRAGLLSPCPRAPTSLSPAASGLHDRSLQSELVTQAWRQGRAARKSNR